MTRWIAVLAAVLLPAALLLGAEDSAAAAKKPSPADIKKHETTPGEKYVPSLDVLRDAPVEEPGVKPGVPVISGADFQRANRIYFERCAGCHGVLRKGATGKALTTDVTREVGYEYLRDFINFGSPAGMPNWGTSGDLNEGDIDLMARYLLQDPPQPPEFGLKEIQATWNEDIQGCNKANEGKDEPGYDLG
jgi:nitrite reductase (NO-forming)/hydroxylamine reductase